MTRTQMSLSLPSEGSLVMQSMSPNPKDECCHAECNEKEKEKAKDFEHGRPSSGS